MWCFSWTRSLRWCITRSTCTLVRLTRTSGTRFCLCGASRRSSVTWTTTSSSWRSASTWTIWLTWRWSGSSRPSSSWTPICRSCTTARTRSSTTACQVLSSHRLYHQAGLRAAPGMGHRGLHGQQVQDRRQLPQSQRKCRRHTRVLHQVIRK